MGIKVYCRVRDGNFNKMIQNNKGCNLHITHKNKKYDFELNKVWNNGETNEQIFEELIQRINNLYKVILSILFRLNDHYHLSAFEFWVSFNFSNILCVFDNSIH